MTYEIDRCRQALQRAVAGDVVALISSGDPGVYGMAGLALELAEPEGLRVPIEVVPGATAAFSHWRPVLLTTGSRNLVPYAQQAIRTGLPLVARILDHPSSRTACQRAGILPERIVVGRGPFSAETNRQHIRQFDIGVLVTKDSGVAGGTEEKLQAAQAEGCQVIVVARPLFAPELDRIPAFNDFDALVEALPTNRIAPPSSIA